jgi:hypothetical protein
MMNDELRIEGKTEGGEGWKVRGGYCYSGKNDGGGYSWEKPSKAMDVITSLEGKNRDTYELEENLETKNDEKGNID